MVFKKLKINNNIKSYLKHRVVSNYFYLMILQAANFLLPLLVLPFLIKTLGTDKFGVVMVALSFTAILNILVDFGFNISATREVSLIKHNRQDLSGYFWSVFSLKLILILISFLGLLLCIFFIPKFHQEAIVYLLSFGLVLGQALFPAWLFQGIEKMRIVTIINVLAKSIFTVLIFIFVHTKQDYILVPLLNSLGFIIAGLTGFALSLSYVDWVKPRLYNLKKMTRENISLLTSNFATSLYTSSNTFILGMIAGDNMAGIYASMEKLVIALKSMFAPLYQSIFPWLAQKNKNEIIKFIQHIKKYIFMAGLSLSLIILIFGKYILELLYHNQQINQYSHVFKILGFIALFASLNMLYVSLLFPALKAYKERMIPMLSGGIFNVILAIFAAYFFNIYGVAMAAVTTEFFILVIALWLYKNRILK